MSPRSYKCTATDAAPHTFVAGTPDYATLLEHPDNNPEPLICPFDGSAVAPLQDTRPVPEEASLAYYESQDDPALRFRGLLTIVADVSGSMFTPVAPLVTPGLPSPPAPPPSIEPVVDALAQVLWELALPRSRPRDSLLCFIVFAIQAKYMTLGATALRSGGDEIPPSFSGTLDHLPTVAEFVEVILNTHGIAPPFQEETREVDALKEAIMAGFVAARAICESARTNYQAPLKLCHALLERIATPAERTLLRPDWGQVETDLREISFVRTIFYSDGFPNEGVKTEKDLEALGRATFSDTTRRDGELTPLCMTASFPGTNDPASIATADRMLTAVASYCPLSQHKGKKCCFPAALAKDFRDILRLTSGGGGFCPDCLLTVRKP